MKRSLICILFSIVFWNVENFFDYKDSGNGPSDFEFSPAGKRHWTAGRFFAKCNGIAKVLLEMTDSAGAPPDIVAFAEVENAFVLRQLCSNTALKKYGYKYVHFDSPDKRGIDCCLIYRYTAVKLTDAKPVSLKTNTGTIIATREILVARFERQGKSLSLLVNHHPSKVGTGGKERRAIAMDTMNAICDSLEALEATRIISVGDFNDNVWKAGKRGQNSNCTIKYNGRWEKIDGCFCRGINVSESVWNSPRLMTADKKFGGNKPLRTYNGLQYQGGLSDHLPILLVFEY